MPASRELATSALSPLAASPTGVASFVLVQIALSSKIFVLGSFRTFASVCKFRSREATRCRDGRVEAPRRGSKFL